MIKEIVEFMDANEGIEDYFIQDEVSESYLHYYIKVKENMICRDLLDINNLDTELKETLKYMTYYQKGMHNKYLDKNKGLGGSSPYILTVKVYYDTHFSTNLKDKADRIKVQFLQASAYINKDECKKFQLGKIKRLLQKNLEEYLLENKIIELTLQEKYEKQKKVPKEKVALEVRVYIDVGLEIVKAFYEKFVEKRAFLDTKKVGIHKGVCSLCNREEELSLPYVLSSLGDEFGQKLTMPIVLTNAICKVCTLKLHKFKVMTDNNQLTKPFPLFIDKPSLFGKQISVLKDNEKKKSYREIIKSIYYTDPKDLKNFYLLNYYSKSDNGWKLQIRDLDYIESFQYMTNIKIINFLNISFSPRIGDLYSYKLSVFQFEKIINELIFEDKLQKNYFQDYKDISITYWKINSSNTNTLLKNYLIKYRQNFYDFIYKSHQSALKQIDFREMLLDVIMDNIKHDQKNKDGFSVYETEIKEKLNFLFSIENYLKEEELDSSELTKLKEELKQSLGLWEEYRDENTIKKRFVGGVDHIELKDENDKLFAFLVGQFARYLLSLSKAKKENLTHADFAGFLDWQDSRLLKEYVLEIFQKYAHEFRYSSNNGKVENAVSIIQSYKEDLKMDSVKEYLIAGYFADNYFYEKTQSLEEKENE